MTLWFATEGFTEDQREILSRYFTNLDGPVFALVNLPEVVKGALFARYSRTTKSLRRLFLDEFLSTGAAKAPKRVTRSRSSPDAPVRRVGRGRGH